jgi:hypothetical protein
MVRSQWLTNQLTPSNLVFLGNLVVANLFRDVTHRILGVTDVSGTPCVPSAGLKQCMKKSRVVSYSPPCVEAEGSLPCSQKPGTLFYSDTDSSWLYHIIPFLIL